jgi:hypothetical protein
MACFDQGAENAELKGKSGFSLIADKTMCPTSLFSFKAIATTSLQSGSGGQAHAMDRKLKISITKEEHDRSTGLL